LIQENCLWLNLALNVRDTIDTLLNFVNVRNQPSALSHYFNYVYKISELFLIFLGNQQALLIPADDSLVITSKLVYLLINAKYLVFKVIDFYTFHHFDVFDLFENVFHVG